MSDSINAQPRRNPPSPLVFSPEASTMNTVASASNSSGTVSMHMHMPFVRRHITRRLKLAKAECDKELQKVTNSITAFFEEKLREEREYEERMREEERIRREQLEAEERLREAERTREEERVMEGHEQEDHRERERAYYRSMVLEDVEMDIDSPPTSESRLPFEVESYPRPPSALSTSALSALRTDSSRYDESSSDGGYEAEGEYTQWGHSRSGSQRTHSRNASTSSPTSLLRASSRAPSPVTRRPMSMAWESRIAGYRSEGRAYEYSHDASLGSSPSTSGIILPDVPLSRTASQHLTSPSNASPVPPPPLWSWPQPASSHLSQQSATSSMMSATDKLSPAMSGIAMSPPSGTSPMAPLPGAPPGAGLVSRRLSRSMHVAARSQWLSHSGQDQPGRSLYSGQSSRSTSRSRSPLPHGLSQDYPAKATRRQSRGFDDVRSSRDDRERRSSRILFDAPIDPIMTALYDLIAVATEITDTTISQLTSGNKVCETFVQRIQNIGKAWDEHPDWHGRNWYVQVLLAVASLSRVVEWFLAEKHFWNFEDREEGDEEIVFVTKGTALDETWDTSSLPEDFRKTIKDDDLEQFSLDGDNRLRFERPSLSRTDSGKNSAGDTSVLGERSRSGSPAIIGWTSPSTDEEGRQSRDVRPKDLSAESSSSTRETPASLMSGVATMLVSRPSVVDPYPVAPLTPASSFTSSSTTSVSTQPFTPPLSRQVSSASIESTPYANPATLTRPSHSATERTPVAASSSAVASTPLVTPLPTSILKTSSTASSHTLTSTVRSSTGQLNLPQPLNKDTMVYTTVPGKQPPVSAASKILGEPESARVLATERLRLQAETAQQSNIVLELSLDGDLIVMVSWMSWKTVVGTDPDELPGTRISRYLAPTFWTVFRDATHLLLNGQRDDIGGNQQYQSYITASQPTQGGQAPSPARPVDIRFKMIVETEDGPYYGPHHQMPNSFFTPGPALYQLMEGKGVLMLDRDDGRPSHTMWVLKPIGSPRWESNIISSDSGVETGDLAFESKTLTGDKAPGAVQLHDGFNQTIQEYSKDVEEYSKRAQEAALQVAEGGQTEIISDQFVVPATAIVPPSSAASLQTGFPFGDPSDHAIVVPDTISFDPILCRICECQIPQWYFEKHSEACAETHRLEAEISDCNESITELRAAIRDLSVAFDQRDVQRRSPVHERERSSSSSSSGSAVLEYRGMPIFSPSSSPVSASPLHLFRNANKMQRLGAKKMQRQILDTLDDILSVAVEISTPALLPDEAKEPIERQRLLPPTSERCLSQIKTWARPQTDDQALKRLINDAERVMRQKADCVVRLQNVIRYAEKVWRQWDERVLEWQRVNEESSGSENETGGEDQDSTASEYAFGAGPTPMESVDATPIPSVSPMPPDSLSPEAVSPMPPASAPLPPASQPVSSSENESQSLTSPLETESLAERTRLLSIVSVDLTDQGLPSPPLDESAAEAQTSADNMSVKGSSSTTASGTFPSKRYSTDKPLPPTPVDDSPVQEPPHSLDVPPANQDTNSQGPEIQVMPAQPDTPDEETASSTKPAKMPSMTSISPDSGVHSTSSPASSSSSSLVSSTRSSPLPSSIGPPSVTSSPQHTPPPPPHMGVRAFQSSHTRSSTPSSVSSPLARAVPIVAAPIPPMDLCESKPVTETAKVPEEPVKKPEDVVKKAEPRVHYTEPVMKSVKASRSSSSLLVGGEPKLVLTPPASPQVHPRDREQTDLTRESSIRRGRGSGTRHRRHSTVNAMPGSAPLSPRQPSVAPLSRTTPTTIKDFDIIKPISKGAFGSVFLARKKATGDYYAIKVLKKADMIAKNQITNVKAERMILMKQAESPFVAKLYFTFQSKENLYLVMEYLNGGDCAALLKSLGCLSEEWAKNYVAEVVLGLEYLHERGIVHRDLKPDNLLINQHGHLKLTDFGLSRIGLLGRQTLEADPLAMSRYGSRSRPPSMDSAYLSSPLIYADHSSNAGGGSYFAIGTRSTSSRTASSSPYLPITDDVSESSGSELAGARLARRKTVAESGVSSFANELTTDLRSHSSNVRSDAGAPPGGQKFAGTPDYLAPETILGLRGNDAMVDWWALGVVTYEFLYGAPPFHDETPEKVFENILSGHVEYHEAWIGYSDEVMDFMTRLLKLDPATRLGANGAQEVKAHPWLRDINWETVTTTEAQFIPQVTDPENTEYFDPRGAIPQLFQDDDQVALPSNTDSPAIDPTMPPPSALSSSHRSTNSRDPGVTSPGDDFGSFSFKNLPVLKQANDDVIRKLKTDQLTPLTQALSESSLHVRRRSVSQRIKKPPNVVTNVDSAKSPPSTIFTNPPSPSTSSSSIASSPSRISLPAAMPGSGGHGRKPSDLGQVERFKLNHLEGERRNSLPSRLRTSSVSSVGDGSGSENWNGSSVGGSNAIELNTPATSIHSIDLKKNPDPNDRVVTCLLAEDNPITSKIIETLLVRIGCRCYTVADGSEAVSVAMSDIKFDCILMDLHMPVLDGEGASRYIKSTNGRNCQTPVIAVSAYSDVDPTADGGSLFAAYLPKPLNKASLLAVMRQLGFKVTSAVQGGPSKVAPAPSLSSGLHDLSRKITA